MADNNTGFVPPPPPYTPTAPQMYAQNLPQGPGLPQTPYTPPPTPAPYENAPEDPLVTKTKKRLTKILDDNPTANFLPPQVDSGVPMGQGQGNYHYLTPTSLVPVEMARQARIDNAQEVVKEQMRLTNLVKDLRDNPQGTANQAIGRKLGNIWNDHPYQHGGGLLGALANAKRASAFAKGQYDDRQQQLAQSNEVTKHLAEMGKTLAGDPKDYQAFLDAYEKHIDNINKDAIDMAGKVMSNQRNYEGQRTAQINAQTAQTQAGSGIVGAGVEQQNANTNAMRQKDEAARLQEEIKQNKIRNTYNDAKFDFDKQQAIYQAKKDAGVATQADDKDAQDRADKMAELRLKHLDWEYEQSKKAESEASKVEKGPHNQQFFAHQQPVTNEEGKLIPSGQPVQAAKAPTFDQQMSQIPTAPARAPSAGTQQIQQAAQQFLGGQQQQNATPQAAQAPSGRANVQSPQQGGVMQLHPVQKSVADMAAQIYQSSQGRLNPVQAYAEAKMRLRAQMANRGQ